MLQEVYKMMMKGKQVTKYKHSTHFFAFAGFSSEISSATWIIDSSERSRIGSKQNIFTELHIFNKMLKKVNHIGCVKLNEEIILENVLYVLVFKYNFLSIGQLTNKPRFEVVLLLFARPEN